MLNHLNIFSILSPFQHGFCSKHSCEIQLLHTVHDIASIHDKNTQVDIGILDFSKSFDVVPHQRLLNKLEHCGVTGNIHKWIGTFLRGRLQKVMVDGHMSDPAAVRSGLPQGTVLGPLLFCFSIMIYHLIYPQEPEFAYLQMIVLYTIPFMTSMINLHYNATLTS